MSVFLKKITVGSVCSGIEAASVAMNSLHYDIKWFSEISDFPSKVLATRYPDTPNIGDMCQIPKHISQNNIFAPDLICGGTPCQAFSLAGWKKGLNDDRGNLTLKFVEIIESNDKVRKDNGQTESIILWENVEGALNDKTNAFGCFLSSILGLSKEISIKKWPQAGIIHGPKRNVAWRVLDAKYFGLPHQRRRLYLIAGGKKFFPENVIFDESTEELLNYNNTYLEFYKNGSKIEVFRDYTDCLYSAYGTKWNGNAAAYNGSLFVSQDNQLRRLTPLECERLMGFPDNYTKIDHSRNTNRYQALGNSWAVPVIKWISERLEKELHFPTDSILKRSSVLDDNFEELDKNCYLYKIITENSPLQSSFFSETTINGTSMPNKPRLGNIADIIDTNPDPKLFISPVGCFGIIRRATERNMKINEKLHEILLRISSTMCPSEIELKSRIQKRGRFSK